MIIISVVRRLLNTLKTTYLELSKDVCHNRHAEDLIVVKKDRN